MDAIIRFLQDTGFYLFSQDGNWRCLIMLGIACVLLYLGIVKKFEPLLLVPIAFGMLITNLPGANMFHEIFFAGGHIHWDLIGGQPVTASLLADLLGPIAVAAYSYMALVPVIQPPIMKLLTTEKERQIVMKPLREVSKKEKIIFPIVVTIFVALLVPSAAPLIACLMLGNLFKECGVTERLSKTVQNELINIVTIFLGVSVGATATGTTFLSFQTIKIMIMGVVAFSFGTAGGVLLAKFMNLFLKEKINPLIGSAGVSAVPMAARVSQMVGQKYNPGNFLLMHAMGPNVAGVIGSAIAAGVLISLYG